MIAFFWLQKLIECLYLEILLHSQFCVFRVMKKLNNYVICANNLDENQHYNIVSAGSDHDYFDWPGCLDSKICVLAIFAEFLD